MQMAIQDLGPGDLFPPPRNGIFKKSMFKNSNI